VPGGSDDDTGTARDSVDDSAPIDDSTDSHDSGDDPFYGMGWVCTVERIRLDMVGLVGLWGDAAQSDAVAADRNGAVFAWSGATWEPVGGLDDGAIAVDGADDGTVWVVGDGDAFVRQTSVWTRLDIPEIEAANPIAVNVDAFEDVTIVSSGTEPDCSGCDDARNYAALFDGYEWSVVEDPDLAQGSATALASLSDGRLVVVGSQGYLRTFQHGAWASIDLGTSTSLRAVAELADGSLLISGNGGVVFAGTLDGGFERVHTVWEGDLFAVDSDALGGAWILGEAPSGDMAQLLHWDGKDLRQVGSPGPWEALGRGPDGALRLAGGFLGAEIATASDAGTAFEWALDGIAPVADIAVADDSVAYSAADGYRDGVIGVYDGEWGAVDLGDIHAITQVETLPGGVALFVTDDANAWRWNGAKATEEVLPAPGIGHYVTGFAARGEVAVAAGIAHDKGENRLAMLEVRDAAGAWSDADLAALPGDWVFALAIDDAGSVWLSGYDSGFGYLAAWTPESGAAIVVPDLEGVAYGLWPKGDGGLWVAVQGDPHGEGIYAFDGTSFVLDLVGLGLDGAHDVVEHPTLGTVAALTYDDATEEPGPAIAVRGKDGTWSAIAMVDDPVRSVAVLPDESILVGTSQGALRLSECAWH
jgi:hypothetical protein